MKVEFRKSFLRDLKRLKDNAIRARVKEVINTAEEITDIYEINDLKKLRYGDIYYRIRVRDYRLGLTLEGDTLLFVRCLHRKDIYKYFP